jgi:DNA-binding transcriptional ArsR family regulator
MDPFAAIADPTRRRIMELLVAGERSAGELTATIRAETGVSQAAVSQHLGVLRESGLAVVRVDAQRRLYRTEPGALRLLAAWIDQVMPGFEPQLDALATEVARGRREQRRARRQSASRIGPDSAADAS